MAPSAPGILVACAFGSEDKAASDVLAALRAVDVGATRLPVSHRGLVFLRLIDDTAAGDAHLSAHFAFASLVGAGTVSFEGNVTSDLDVRYSLVDRLGPFTQLVYWIQESLLRVSIRGTVERPAVVLRGLAFRFFTPAEDRDRLPLPGFSRRPRRF